MAKRLVEESSLIAVADAIRNKGGTTEELNFPSGFKSAIEAIETDNGGIVPEGTIEITENGTHDVANYASANVNVPTQSEDGGIVPSGTIAITENGTYDVTNYANANVAFPEVERAVPVISVDSNGLITADAIQEAGVVSEGTETATNQLPTQAGTTITPGTSNKTAVAAGKYTTGDVTVEGDSNLVAGNIKSGVSIFGVSGSYEGTGGSSDASDTDIEVGSLSELHAWNKYSIAGVTKTPQTNVFLGTALHNEGITVEYADKEDTSSGSLALSTEGYGTVTVTSDSSGAILKGKVVRITANASHLYYEIPTTATVDFQSGTLYDNLYVSEANQITYTSSDGELVGIVVSEDSSAYPQNGEQDGYKYVYNGTLDDTASEPVLQSKSVTPSETAQTVTPDSGYDGLSSVTVAGDADLVASNIKRGVSIFNVTGTMDVNALINNALEEIENGTY